MVAQKEDVPEGPYIQSMPSEQIRNQLTSMSRVLHKAIKLVQPEDRQVDTESQLSHRNTGKSFFYFAVKNDRSPGQKVYVIYCHHCVHLS